MRYGYRGMWTGLILHKFLKLFSHIFNVKFAQFNAEERQSTKICFNFHQRRIILTFIEPTFDVSVTYLHLRGWCSSQTFEILAFGRLVQHNLLISISFPLSILCDTKLSLVNIKKSKRIFLPELLYIITRDNGIKTYMIFYAFKRKN